MSLTTTNNEAALNISFKYDWNIDRDSLEKCRSKETIESPLFGPDNFEDIKFQLQFGYQADGACPYFVGLLMVSCTKSCLDLKCHFLLKNASDERPHKLKGVYNINLSIGNPIRFSVRNLVPVEHVQVKIELNLPEIFQTPLIKLISDLNSLRSKARFTDVTFVIGTKEFPAHKNILSARSPVFEVMFSHADFVENQQNRVDITDIDEKVFGALLDFIYTSEVKQLDEIAPELLVAAHKYDIKSLFDECVKSMLESMNKENVVHYLVHAKMYNLELLKDKAIDLINRNALKVTNSEDFVKHVKPDLLLMHELYLDFVKKYPQI